MTRRTMPFTIASALLIVSACGRADSDPASGGLTVGEAESLDRAATRLDERAPSPGGADAEALESDVRARLAAETNEKSAN
ncbi:MAG: hypothetical protein ABL882_06085 [Sphingopyxis sp.]